MVNGLQSVPGEAAMRSARTFRCDLLRGASQGILESWWLTLGVLVVVRIFEGGLAEKSLAASANYLGQLMAPLAVMLFARISPSQAASRVLQACALCLLLAAGLPGISFFLLFFILAAALNDWQWPFLTTLYSTNYAAHERGRKVSLALMLSMTCAGAFALLAGQMLDADKENYRWLLGLAALAAAGAAGATRKIPWQTENAAGNGRQLKQTLSAFRALLTNRRFTLQLASWMLLGTGNTLMLPLRIDYLADPAYGHAFSAVRIAFLCATLPMLCRILSMPLWGWLFDRSPLNYLRNAVILFFAAGLSLFFSGHFMAGSCLTGIGMGGGFLLWNLWVTRVVATSEVSAAMSLNSLLTGLRGSLAPWIGFATAASFGLEFALGLSLLGLAAALFPGISLKADKSAPPTS